MSQSPVSVTNTHIIPSPQPSASTVTCQSAASASRVKITEEELLSAMIRHIASFEDFDRVESMTALKEKRDRPGDDSKSLSFKCDSGHG